MPAPPFRDDARMQLLCPIGGTDRLRRRIEGHRAVQGPRRPAAAPGPGHQPELCEAVEGAEHPE
ncbi:hypothetical protein [Gordonia sp. McavH-238-E]|uniref:hypothetical protein n=1 Tax=Gordonia sp. McavH-238-E TaxID=2917736 RepID=UPI001EF7006F|nr:hypothetical protein [Gordonia sp. McavH-238-E]